LLAESAKLAESGQPSPSEIFGGLFGHLMPTEFARVGPFPITNHLILMLIASLVILQLFTTVARRISGGKVGRGPLVNMFEALVVFVRDEMVYDTMGKETGRKFAPLFLTQFFFIWVVNLLGLLPLPKIGGTATASLNVAAALATSTFIFMIACGLKASGPVGMWKSLVPHGVPGAMWPLMFVVELLGFFVKPFALVIRLFANMTGGHLVLLSMFGLIYVFQSWAVFGGVMPMALFIGILELLVAFLQAFIFTFLSIMFVQGCVHPEH
jgi:F-type H+-transporting ATPase subunit a